jgi:hypothetical protein
MMFVPHRKHIAQHLPRDYIAANGRIIVNDETERI